jgi:hypothetical protein
MRRDKNWLRKLARPPRKKNWPNVDLALIFLDHGRKYNETFECLREIMETKHLFRMCSCNMTARRGEITQYFLL